MSTLTTKFYEQNTAAGHAAIIADLTNLHNWDKIETVNDYQTRFYLPSGSYILCGRTASGYTTTLELFNPQGVTLGTVSTDVMYIVETEKCLCLHGYSNTAIDPTDYRIGAIIITNGKNVVTNSNYNDIAIYISGTSSTTEFKFADDTARGTTLTTSSVYFRTGANVLVATPTFSFNSDLVTDNALMIEQTPYAARYFGDVTLCGKKYFQKGTVLLADF